MYCLWRIEVLSGADIPPRFANAPFVEEANSYNIPAAKGENNDALHRIFAVCSETTRVRYRYGRKGATLHSPRNTLGPADIKMRTVRKKQKALDETAFRLSRIYAEGWNAGRGLSLIESEERDGGTLNPYTSEPQRSRWIEGFTSATGKSKP